LKEFFRGSQENVWFAFLYSLLVFHGLLSYVVFVRAGCRGLRRQTRCCWTSIDFLMLVMS